MRIGFLLPANLGLAGPGNGIRRQAEAQAEALETLGNEVVRLDPWRSVDPGSFDIVQFFAGGFAHHRIEARWAGVGATVFAPIIDTNVSNFAYRVAARVGSLHPKIRTLQGMYRRQGLLADGVVCRSRFERLRLERGLGIPSGKIRVILNGVEPSPLPAPPGVTDELGLPHDFLLFVGAYGNPRKNVQRLIEAARSLGYPLVIAGSSVASPEAARIEKIAADSDDVQLVGFLTGARRDALYSACRVFCLPSRYEGTGLAALEAGAAGAKVVVTDRGGPPDYFDGLAEYVDPFDVASIRRGLERAWNAAPTSALADHLRNNLTWENSARSLAAFYEELLASA